MATKKKPTTKTTKTAKPAAKPAKSAPGAAKSKGKRYTTAERSKIIAFVDSVNAAKGRGGAAAAVKKFGVTALTISSWIKKSGGPQMAGKTAKTAKTAPKLAARATKKTGDTLDQLITLRDEIRDLESLLAAKNAQFARLKAQL